MVRDSTAALSSHQAAMPVGIAYRAVGLTNGSVPYPSPSETDEGESALELNEEEVEGIERNKDESEETRGREGSKKGSTESSIPLD